MKLQTLLVCKSSARSVIVCLTLVVCCGAVFSQNKHIDSLNTLLEEDRHVDRYSVLYELTFEYLSQSDFTTALGYISQARALALSGRDSLRIVKAYRVEAQVLRKLSRTQEAIALFVTALPIAQRNAYLEEEKYILNGLAVAHTFLAEYDKALKYNYASLEIREKEGDLEELCIAHNNIGIVHFKLKNYEEALKNYLQAFELKKQSGNRFFRDQLLINIGLCYNQLKEFDQARIFIMQAIEECRENCSDEAMMSSEFGLGVSLFGVGQFQEAEGHFVKSYEMAEKLKDLRFQIETMVYRSKINIKLERYDLATEILGKAEQLALTTNYNELLIDIFRQYSILANITENFPEAARYQQRYIRLKDSIYNEALIKNLASVQTAYDARENMKATSEKDDSLAMNERIIASDRQVYFFIAAVSVLAIVAAYVLFRFNRRQHIANNELDARTEK